MPETSVDNEIGPEIGDQSPPPSRSRLSNWARPLLTVGVFVVFCVSPVLQNGDAYLAGPTAYSIVHDRSIALDEFTSHSIVRHYSTRVADGHRYDFFPWPTAIFAIPPVLLLDATHSLGIGPGSFDLLNGPRGWVVSLAGGALACALLTLVLSYIVEEMLTVDRRLRRRWAIGTALVAALTTTIWSVASRALWQHGPAMLYLALGILAALHLDRTPRHPRHRVWALTLGAGLAAAAVTRPALAPACVALGVWLGFRSRRAFAGALAGAAAVAAGFLSVNFATFGEPLTPYYGGGRVGYHNAYFQALAANLVSPSRGLLIFSPAVLLAGTGAWLAIRHAATPHRSLLLASGIGIVVTWFAVSGFRSTWWAGNTYGPRFMTDVIPLLVFVACPAINLLANGGVRRSAVFALVLAVGWGAIVNAEGALLRSTTCWNTTPVDVDKKPRRVWDWNDPQFLSGFDRLVSDGPHAAVLGACPRTTHS